MPESEPVGWVLHGCAGGPTDFGGRQVAGGRIDQQSRPELTVRNGVSWQVRRSAAWRRVGDAQAAVVSRIDLVNWRLSQSGKGWLPAGWRIESLGRASILGLTGGRAGNG